MNSTKQREVVYGGKAIAHEIEVLDGAGEPNLRKIYYMLEMGYVPGARKIGEKRSGWVLSIPTYRRAMHGDAA